MSSRETSGMRRTPVSAPGGNAAARSSTRLADLQRVELQKRLRFLAREDAGGASQAPTGRGAHGGGEAQRLFRRPSFGQPKKKAGREAVAGSRTVHILDREDRRLQNPPGVHQQRPPISLRDDRRPAARSE